VLDEQEGKIVERYEALEDTKVSSRAKVKDIHLSNVWRYVQQTDGEMQNANPNRVHRCLKSACLSLTLLEQQGRE
jgi:hypothetical protein